jgi:hypothetical protein
MPEHEHNQSVVECCLVQFHACSASFDVEPMCYMKHLGFVTPEARGCVCGVYALLAIGVDPHCISLRPAAGLPATARALHNASLRCIMEAVELRRRNELPTLLVMVFSAPLGGALLLEQHIPCIRTLHQRL